MFRKLGSAVPVFALVVITALPPGAAHAQRKVNHPRLRAALHELREARTWLRAARDSWPPGYRERALRAIDNAIQSVRTILDVRDIDNFRGVDRNPDYYKRFADHPRLRAALSDLRDARDELRAAKTDFKGRKTRALEDIEMAIGDILVLLRYTKGRG